MRPGKTRVSDWKRREDTHVDRRRRFIRNQPPPLLSLHVPLFQCLSSCRLERSGFVFTLFLRTLVASMHLKLRFNLPSSFYPVYQKYMSFSTLLLWKITCLTCRAFPPLDFPPEFSFPASFVALVLHQILSSWSVSEPASRSCLLPHPHRLLPPWHMLSQH